MAIKEYNLDPSLKSIIASAGVIGAGSIKYVVKAGSNSHTYWGGRAPGEDFYASPASGASSALKNALASCTAGRNDIVAVSQDSHTLGESLVWDKNNTHMIGMCGGGIMNMRSRIGHNDDFDKLIDVTGEGCILHGIYMMYGRDGDTNLTALRLKGNRNTLNRCHIGGPMHATPADEAGFRLIYFEESSAGSGLEHYIKDCVIGIETVAWTNGVMMRTKGTPRLVFDNTMFLMRADNAQVQFLDGTLADGQGFVLFKNCTGINLGTALTTAFGSTGLAAGTDYIIHGGGFSGATDLIAAAKEAQVKGIASPAATDAVSIGLATDYDHTA